MNPGIPTPKTMQQHRFHLLDGVRGIAAAMVFLFHSPAAVAHYFPNAYLAVDLFFCLSGFVIAYSYEHRLENKLDTKNFFIVRLIRFYPIYLLGTVLLILRSIFNHEEFAFAHSSPGYFAANILLALLALPRFALPWLNLNIYPFNPPAWSLLAEMIANVGYAIAIRKAIKWTLPVVCLVSLVWLVLTASYYATMNNPTLLISLVRVCFSFPVGVFLYTLYRKRSTLHRSASYVAVAAGMLVTILSLSFHSSAHNAWPQLLVIVLVFPPLVYFGAGVKVPSRLTALCVLLGEASYPIYMLHGIFRIPDTPSVGRFSEHHPLLMCLAVFIDLIILGFVCIWVNRRFDEPIRKKITTWYRARTESKLQSTLKAISQ